MKFKNLALLFAAIFLLSSCNNSNNGGNSDSTDHEHTFSSKWEYDDKSHWHDTTCGHDVKGSEGSHTFDDGVVREPTFDKEGYKTFTCTVCGYYYETDKKDKLEHNYSSEWSSDPNYHWHACTDAGYEDLKSDNASHNFYCIKTVQPTYIEDGYSLYQCSYCGYSHYS